MEALKIHRFLTQAADVVGINRGTVYLWREGDQEFRKAMDEIDGRMVDELRAEGFRRAMQGAEGRPPSDFLLERFLRARDTAFREQANVQVNLNFVTMLVGRLQEIVQRVIPIKCPHCSKMLPARQEMAREMESLGHIDVDAIGSQEATR